MTGPDAAHAVAPRDGAERAASAVAPRAVRFLRDWLTRVSYSSLYPLVTGGELVARSAERAASSLARLTGLAPEERAALTLFALGGELDPGTALGTAGGAVAPLLESGLLVGGEGGPLATRGFVVVPVLGGLLATGMPPGSRRSRAAADRTGDPEGIGASAYLGPDSLRLAATLPDARHRRVLDLGTGSGIQGLLAVRDPAEVVATDVDERSLELAATNVLLNETPHPVRVVRSDCYDALDGERFDLVVALPPYVPSVEGSSLRSTVSAGRDGLDVVRRVLAGAREHLTGDGSLVVRCQLLAADDGPLLVRELDGLTRGCDVRVVLGAPHPLQPYAAELAASISAERSIGDYASLYASFLCSLRSLGATGVSSATIEATAVRGPGTVRVVAPRAGVGRPHASRGLVLELDAASRVARSDRVAPVLLDGPSAALLAAVDGQRDVEQLVAQAWGTVPEESRRDVLDQARSRLSQLATLGLVEPG
ncbi:MAG: methyltransferase [Actinomycetota bacterium]|nr:methyltransferase [Actinomycetota bacterium]